jgi:hypothetical protein
LPIISPGPADKELDVIAACVAKAFSLQIHYCHCEEQSDDGLRFEPVEIASLRSQ